MAKKKVKKRRQDEPWSLGDCMAKIQKSEEAAKKKKLTKKEFLKKMMMKKKKKTKKKIKKYKASPRLSISDSDDLEGALGEEVEDPQDCGEVDDGLDEDEDEDELRVKKEEIASKILDTISYDFSIDREEDENYLADFGKYLDEYVKIRFGELLTKVFNSPIVKRKLNQSDLEKIKRGMMNGRI